MAGFRSVGVRARRQEQSRVEAATALYERFLATEATLPVTLEDAAMEAIVTGLCDRTLPDVSLGVPLPTADLDQARTGPLREAVALLDPVVARPARSRRGTLVLAARCLYALHHETGETAPLRRAVGLWEHAATAGDEDAALLHDLSVAQLELAAFEDRLLHTQSAARSALTAVKTCSEDDERKPVYRCGLSRAFGAAFEQTGDDDFRNEALYQAACAATEGAPLPAEQAYTLGSACLISFEATGSQAEIEYAVNGLRDAVDLEARPEYLLALARALRLLYPRNRDERILREAVEMSRLALAAVRPSDPARYRYLEQAAHSRFLSHQVHAVQGVVDVAVSFQRLAVGTMSEDHPDRTAAIGLLADIWLARHEKTGKTFDFVGALESCLAAEKLSRGTKEHHVHLARNSRAARVLYADTGDTTHVHIGVRAIMRALDEEDLPEHRRAAYLLQAAALLVDYTDQHPDDEMRRGARKMLFTCLEIDDAEPQVRAEAGRLWADLAVASESWTEAGLAYLHALQAMGTMAGIEVSRQSQESTLHRFSGVASAAAACHLHAGDPESALLALEMGRAVMMAQSLELYDTARALQQSDAELGRSLVDELKKRDESAASLGRRLILASKSLPGDGRISDEYRRSSHNLRVLQRKAGQVPGYKGLTWFPTPEELLEASGPGPIVVLNLSPLRSDALVLRPSGTTVVPLPAVTPDAVDNLVRTFQAAAVDPDPAAEATMLDGLAWLWDNVAEPVLAVAVPAPEPAPHDAVRGDLPRLWWCPTGPLSFLPLHAAGHHREADGRTVLERVVSSYTPTIRALRRVRARKVEPSPAAEAGLLAVAVSRTESGDAPLPGALSEAAVIAGLHPATAVLADAEATRDRLLSELPGYRRVHFTCHARSDERSPSLSHLVLYGIDDALRVDDIARLDLSSVELAFLSVCDAARPDHRITDEALHIAGAFLIAGYPDVVGTLWPMPDAVGPQVARRFYRRLAEGCEPACALHHAVMQAYRRAPDSPTLWANLVHVGG